MAMNHMSAKKRGLKKGGKVGSGSALSGGNKEHYLIPDQNPPVDSEKLNAFNGKPTGQGYGAARIGPDVV
tara:strand:- start:174 stop:383 length:210 start_codon:yes stop_codon:yes gene_type:complete